MVVVDYSNVPDVALARVVHEANRAYNVFLDDPVPDPPWDALPQWHKGMIIARVQAILGGWDPADIHQDWVDTMSALGWSFGVVKDPDRMTHPAVRPWGELPVWQRRKDELAVMVVRALCGDGVKVLEG